MFFSRPFLILAKKKNEIITGWQVLGQPVRFKNVEHAKMDVKLNCKRSCYNTKLDSSAPPPKSVFLVYRSDLPTYA